MTATLPANAHRALCLQSLHFLYAYLYPAPWGGNVFSQKTRWAADGPLFSLMATQEHVAMQVCRACDINPADVVYVEAHGTGTVVGDAQELMAIDRLYGSGAGRTAEDPLLIGSVKSNMGHCEGASGMAGVTCPELDTHMFAGNGWAKSETGC